MKARITVNGRTYDRPEDMPAEVRRLYEDALRRAGPAFAGAGGSGLPDPPGPAGAERRALVVENRLLVNGREYAGLDELPADLRHACEQALRHAGLHPGVAKGPARLDLSVTLGRPARFPGEPCARPMEPSLTLPVRVVAALLALAAAVVGLGWLARLGRPG